MRLLVTVIAITLALGCKKEPAAVTTAPQLPVFELRLVLDSPSVDSEQVALVHRDAVGHVRELLNLQTPPVLNGAMVKEAWPWKRGSVMGMDIMLTDKGREQLAELTRRNVGKQVAIIICGQVREIKKIQSEYDFGTFAVISNWTEEEAIALAKKIRESAVKR
jgi:preprotein translocase subunit SecD